jgi:UDP-N-acetyl-D-galactosamine dehydrogenase
MNTNNDIAVIGLGYVGLPLAVEFAKKRKVLGFHIKQSRINELIAGHDPTLEVSDEELIMVLGTGLTLTSNIEDLREANYTSSQFLLRPTNTIGLTLRH